MTDAPEQAALRDQCTVFLTGHGPVRPADLLASIPADTVPDRYGDGGVVAELEAEMALSGEVIDARTALDWGLVNRVVPGAQLDSAVHDLLERVTQGSAQSKGIGKQALYAQIDLDQPKAYAYAVEVMAATSQLPDAQEGMRAFLEKRKPNWDRGRS